MVCQKKGLQDGSCGLPTARELCPKTCSNCRMHQPCVHVSHAAEALLRIVPSSAVARLSAWTWSAISSAQSPAVCLASQQRCDSTTSCGGKINSLHECEQAAHRLLNGTTTLLQLSNGKATQLSVDTAPRGCFFVHEVLLFVEQEQRKRTL